MTSLPADVEAIRQRLDSVSALTLGMSFAADRNQARPMTACELDEITAAIEAAKHLVSSLSSQLAEAQQELQKAVIGDDPDQPSTLREMAAWVVAGGFRLRDQRDQLAAQLVELAAQLAEAQQERDRLKEQLMRDGAARANATDPATASTNEEA